MLSAVRQSALLLAGRRPRREPNPKQTCQYLRRQNPKRYGTACQAGQAALGIVTAPSGGEGALQEQGALHEPGVVDAVAEAGAQTAVDGDAGLRSLVSAARAAGEGDDVVGLAVDEEDRGLAGDLGVQLQAVQQGAGIGEDGAGWGRAAQPGVQAIIAPWLKPIMATASCGRPARASSASRRPAGAARPGARRRRGSRGCGRPG